MRFKAVLIDIDDTLFDFRESSYLALRDAFAHFGVDFSREEFPSYEVCNNYFWQAYERGEVEKDEIFPGRFKMFFERKGLDIDPEAMNRLYLDGLAMGYAFMPHCRELLQALHGRYKVFVITNGDTFAQESRIRRSGLSQYFDQVFISEQMGCKKPEKIFFDKVFQIIGQEYRDCSLVVGDSLTSDMQGGRNAGLPTCLYGKKEKAEDRKSVV